MSSKHYLFVLLLAVCLLSNVQAEVQSLGTFKVNSCVDLPQICSTCTYNNISTIKYPNASVIESEIAMAKSGTYYSYSFCNTSQLGQYIVNGYGDIDGVLTTWVYDFQVTNSGYQNTTAGSIIYIGLLVFSIILFIIVVLCAGSIKWKNEREPNGSLRISDFKYLKYPLYIVAYIIFMWIMALCNGIATNLLYLGFMGSFFYWAYIIMLVGIAPVLIIGGIVIIMTWINDGKLQDMIAGGFEV
jgi:hypothetical protein